MFSKLKSGCTTVFGLAKKVICYGAVFYGIKEIAQDVSEYVKLKNLNQEVSSTDVTATSETLDRVATVDSDLGITSETSVDTNVSYDVL